MRVFNASFRVLGRFLVLPFLFAPFFSACGQNVANQLNLDAFYESQTPPSRSTDARFESLFDERSTESLDAFVQKSWEGRFASANDLLFFYDVDLKGYVVSTILDEPENEKFKIPSKIEGKPVVMIDMCVFGETLATSISIPKSVRKIGYLAFYNAEWLERAKIPERTTELGDSAFWGCSSLRDPAAVFGMNPVFGGVETSKLDPSGESEGFVWYERRDDGVAIRGVNVSPKQLRIPETIDGKPVVEIGAEAFASCDELLSVELPKTIKKIGNRAFDDCWRLASLNIPTAVEEIGGDALRNCESLDLGKAFGDHPRFGVASFEKDDAVRRSENPADRNYLWFEKTDSGEAILRGSSSPWIAIELPESFEDRRVVAIGERAFSTYFQLERVVVPEGTTRIDESAFPLCDNLREVVLPSTLKSIGKDAFYQSEELVDLAIPASVEEIATGAFFRCVSLDYSKAFAENPRFGAVDVAEWSVGDEPQGFVWYEKKENGVALRGICADPPAKRVRIPEKIEKLPVIEIGDRAFLNNEELIDVAMPDTVERIGDSAFEHCGELARVRFSNGLKTLGADAFGDSPLLYEPRLPSHIVEVGRRAFPFFTVFFAQAGSETEAALAKSGYGKK